MGCSRDSYATPDVDDNSLLGEREHGHPLVVVSGFPPPPVNVSGKLRVVAFFPLFSFSSACAVELNPGAAVGMLRMKTEMVARAGHGVAEKTRRGEVCWTLDSV